MTWKLVLTIKNGGTMEVPNFYRRAKLFIFMHYLDQENKRFIRERIGAQRVVVGLEPLPLGIQFQGESGDS